MDRLFRLLPVAALVPLLVISSGREAHAQGDSLLEKLLPGLEFPGLVLEVNRLAEQERFVEALRPAQKALEISEAVFGPNHETTASSHFMVASLLLITGDLSQAREHLEKCLVIQEKLDREGPEVAGVLKMLGSVLRDMGRFDDAKAKLTHALEIYKRRLGEDHLSTADSLDSLGVLLQEMGDFAEARRQFELALAIRLRQLPANHAELATSYHNLGASLQEMGDLSGAIAHLEKALAIVLEANGPESVVTAQALNGFGGLLTVTGDYDRAEKYLRNALEIYVEKLGEDSVLVARSLNNIAHLQKIDHEVKLLERKIARGQESEGSDSISWERVQEELPECSVLIELFLYWPPDVLSFTVNEPRYVAYVLGNSGPPRVVDLGEAAAIDEAAKSLVEALGGKRPDVRERAQELYRQSFAKLEPFLSGADLLLIAPDAELHLVPFAALVDENGDYLVERFAVSYLTSGRDLLRLHDNAWPREGPLIVADPDFGARPPAGENRGTARRAADLGSLALRRLPATADEAVEVGERLHVPADRILTGKAATESALKRVAGPEVLHVATHGFFLPERPEELLDPLRPEAGARPDDPLVRSGLALAGFQNWQMTTDSDDGVLTAQEVAQVDLRGTEIVVLSACETGVGEVRSGRGVFGLRRALVLAGARTQVMTLWQVADEPTKEVMVSWYEQVLRGVPRAEAMRRAQLAALRGKPLPGTGVQLRGTRPLSEDASELGGGRHPYYWAPFIVSGEPGR